MWQDSGDRMLLQTNGYLVPPDRRAAHARLVRRFRAAMRRLGCDRFEVFEQVGPGWHGGETSGRFIQMMGFRDRAHQKQVHDAEQQDPEAQQIIADFCALIDYDSQQQQKSFITGYYRNAVEGPQEAAAAAAPPEPAAPSPERPDVETVVGEVEPAD